MHLKYIYNFKHWFISNTNKQNIDIYDSLTVLTFWAICPENQCLQQLCSTVVLESVEHPWQWVALSLMPSSTFNTNQLHNGIYPIQWDIRA
jgi:hypothetical protein